MQTIWKFEIKNNLAIEIPINAEILTAQTQNGIPCLWILVDPEAEKQTRHFNVYGTGQMITENPGKYINTFQMQGGLFIFHVFEKTI